MEDRGREIRYEWLRPEELVAERERCPLVFVPVGPLEYHGPHLPLGVDAINAGRVAREACRRLGKGVVHPTLHLGAEGVLEPWMYESLGFPPDSSFLGMDFPSARWKSHYAAQHIFALALASCIEALIAQGYRVIAVANGHGAACQLQTIERLSMHYTRTSAAVVVGEFTFVADPQQAKLAGHADLYETSLMLDHEAAEGGRVGAVDLSRLPPRGTPIRYQDFSIVDGPGFGRNPPPDRIVRADPRDATREFGVQLFEGTVAKLLATVEAALAKAGIAESGGLAR